MSAEESKPVTREEIESCIRRTIENRCEPVDEHIFDETGGDPIPVQLVIVADVVRELPEEIYSLQLSASQLKVTWEGDDIMTALICSAMQNIWEAEGAPTETHLKKSLDTALDRLRAALQLCTPEPFVALAVKHE